MMPNTMEIAIKSMMEDAVTQAVASLAEKHGFDQEDALRELNLSDLKLVRKRGPSPKSDKKKATGEKKEKKEKKPRKLSGYQVFSKEERAAAVEGVKLTMAELGARWKALSKEEQAVWVEKAKQDDTPTTSEASSPAERFFLFFLETTTVFAFK